MENVNETEFENVLNSDNTLNENVVENIENTSIEENSTNSIDNNVLNDNVITTENETIENTVVTDDVITLDTIHNDLGVIVSFFCIFSVVILVKIILKFFSIFF